MKYQKLIELYSFIFFYKICQEIEDLQKENFKLHQEKLDEATKHREQDRKDSIQVTVSLFHITTRSLLLSSGLL